MITQNRNMRLIEGRYFQIYFIFQETNCHFMLNSRYFQTETKFKLNIAQFTLKIDKISISIHERGDKNKTWSISFIEKYI